MKSKNYVFFISCILAITIKITRYFLYLLIYVKVFGTKGVWGFWGVRGELCSLQEVSPHGPRGPESAGNPCKWVGGQISKVSQTLVRVIGV